MDPKNAAAATLGFVGSTLAIWRTMCPWLYDDMVTMKSINRQSYKIQEAIAENHFVVDKFEEQVLRVPRKTFIIFENKEYTYEFINNMANRVAYLVSGLGLKPGDVVATMIYNEPAFVWTFLGLMKLGLVDAFINYNLRSRTLLHSFHTSEAKLIIVGYGSELLESVDEIKAEIPSTVPIYVYTEQRRILPTRYLSMDEALIKAFPVPVYKSVRGQLSIKSNVCYIYTSGTTGLPKPAIMNQAKAIGLSKFYQQIFFTEKDTVYVVTPLYHSAALGHGLLNTIDVGATIVLRKKFSASKYWDDVRTYNVTVIQYIGELCRYLLKTPTNASDGKHNVRAAMGNGLRPDIWMEFKTRFKIPWIVEFFGATEGTSTFVNVTGQVGACGRLSPLMNHLSSGRQGVQNCAIRYDILKDTPVRNKNGHCIKIKKGEFGLLIAGIPKTYTGFYKGSKEINEKKIIRNVFKDGDSYFNFGDLAYMDDNYYIYFKDRVGDTFRWKGENVSTREVCDVISSLDFIHDVNVYGVKIADADGRAGMAAISLKDGYMASPDILQQIFNKCEHELPIYARPIFLRFQKEFRVTQTMKHRKIEMQEEGFDPTKINDDLFYRNSELMTYTPLDIELFESVLKSKL